MEENFDGDYILADDGQVSQMQAEYSKLGIGAGENVSRLNIYPLPVYMIDKCFEFCKAAKQACAIFSQLDKLFLSRNKREIDFITTSVEKNRIVIAGKAEMDHEIFLPIQRMPIKQSMYKLLELFNTMSIMLDDLSVYIKSVDMQEVVMRHLLANSVLHSLCV